MDKRINELISGTSYSLYDLFGENRIIVIPDLQRDYCWAETLVDREDKPSLVQCYVNDLIKASKEIHAEMKMGLLYGYEYPHNSVQLCDGQQRLTTLYLICGVCCRILKHSESSDYSSIFNQAQKILSIKGISRLQYAVRDTTLSFLNNIVEYCAFYENVDKEDWFSGEYAKDPSVKNMVTALNQIADKVNTPQIARDLLTFILHKISFLYFDMRSREFSEEQYVILNTTGMLLTPTEHIKPKLLGLLVKDSNLLQLYSEKWESWEQFIWEHRMHNDENFTVDEWFNRLLKIFYLTEYALQGENAGKEVKDFDSYQRILQGSIKYDFPQDDIKSVVSTLNTIDRFFDIAKFVDQNNIPLSLGLSTRDGRIPQTNIWEYLSSDNWKNLGCLQQSVAVFSILNKATQSQWDKDKSLSISLRVLELAWVQSQYKSENQDVAKFLAFIDSIDIDGDSIYQIAKDSDLFSDGLKKKKFPLLSNIQNGDSIAPLESAFAEIAHLNTSRGQISYVFEILDEVTSDNLIVLKNNLLLTTENITSIIRRSLLSYGNYHLNNGACSWGTRYDFAYSTNFFFDQLHKVDAPRKEVILSFIKDIALKDNVIDYLKSRITNFHPIPVDDSELSIVIERIYTNPRYFNKMKFGRIAIGDKRAFAMDGNKVSYGDIRILDSQRDSLIYDTFERLSSDKWELEYGFTLRKWFEVKILNEEPIWIRVSGDYHYSDNHQIVFCPYINLSWNEKYWPKIKEKLLVLYPEYIFIDEGQQYIHLPIVDFSSVDEITKIMKDYFFRLIKIRIE